MIAALAEAVVMQRGRAPLERALRARISRIFRAQSRAFPAQRVAASLLERRRWLVEALDPEVEAEIMAVLRGEWPHAQVPIAEVLTQAGAQAADLSMNYTLASIGLPRSDSISPALVDWLANHSIERATGIEETSMVRIRDVLARGIESDQTAAQIARNIRSEFAGWTRSTARGRLSAEERAIVRRAEMIAVTEIAEAWEESSYRVYEGHGFEYVVWISSNDDRTCEDCISNEMAGPVRLGDPFPTGHLHPPAHPLDRCAVGAHIE